jgi:hypothetical protein
MIQETISQHLQKGAMELAYTCQAHKDLDDDTVKQAHRLLVHTHTFPAVMRFVNGRQDRPWKDTLWTVLDQINKMLNPVIVAWTEDNASPLEHASTAGDESADQRWAASILRQVVQQGGLAFRALHFLEPVVASSRLTILQEWAQSSWIDVQDRLLLVGILFGPRALLSQLCPHSGCIVFPAACRSLLDLNSLVPFDKSLRTEVAVGLLCFGTPQALSSCVAWVGTLGMALQGLATDSCTKEEVCLDHDIFKTASFELIKTIQWAAGWEGWRPFIQDALWALSIIYTNQSFAEASGSNVEHLREVAESVKVKLNDEVQAHKQADELLSKLELFTLVTAQGAVIS